ncbi:MAG: NADH-quinone oxidoreductase subunit M [Sedimenticola sp.]
MVGINEIHWTANQTLPLLAFLQLLPLAGVMIVLLVRRSRSLLFYVGLTFSIAELLLAFFVYWQYDSTTAAMQFAEHLELFPFFNYHAAVDGISILFLLLATLLCLLLVLYGAGCKLGYKWRFLVLLLVTESALVGMFVTQDLFWFLLLSVVEMLLAGFMLWQWSTAPDRDLAIARYLQFMGTGLLLLLVGILMLGWNHVDVTGGHLSFDLQMLIQTPVNPAIGSLVFFLLFYGFGIRIPIFPLHGWLPIAAEHGSVALAPVLLIGLKVGVYGLLRFVFPLMPEVVMQWHLYVVAIAGAGIFYAAVLALKQVNLRRLLAYAVVSHTSVLMIGLFTLNLLGLQGSVMLSINFGLAGAGLLLMSGFVYHRTNTLLLARLGGLFDRIPFIGITFLVAGLSIVGMPGTPGFDAVHLMMEAAIEEFGALVTVAAALGNVVAAGFLLWAFQSAFLTPRPAGEGGGHAIPHTSGIERLVAGIVLLILLLTGFFSGPWLELIEAPLQLLDSRFGHTVLHPGALHNG